jgi:heptosyltransferase II
MKMNILIIKLGATGDVVRTTPLLRRFEGAVDWVTSSKNRPLLDELPQLDLEFRVFSWDERSNLNGNSYDLVINLEDDLETASVLKSVRYDRVFGAYIGETGAMTYSEDARRWFDLSLISVHGRKQADVLKLQNRHTYQEFLFDGLKLGFRGERYLLPPTNKSPLQGEVAIAPEAGAVWPMKRWAYYDALKSKLEAAGLKVNVLGTRPTLLEHLADVRGHQLLVSGDTLPMHLALGSGVRCVTLFNCTSPWEIHDYGIQRKIVSPLLEQFFYKRGYEERATTAIGLEEVFDAVMAQINAASPETNCVAQSGSTLVF